MGTEVAIPFFGPLILIGTGVLIYVAISGRGRPISESSFLGIGRSRLALGFLGVLVASILSSYWETTDLSAYKVAEGHVSQAEAKQLFWGWFLSLFCLSTPFIWFFSAVFGLPILRLLRRFNLLSTISALVASQIIPLILAFFALLMPDGGWCQANRLRCATGRYWEVAPLFGMVAIGFALASRLPWIKGTRHAS